MADIGIANCTIYKKLEGDVMELIIVTPATADSADTIDVSTYVPDYNVLSVFAYDKDTGDTVTGTIAPATNVITIDAAGSTTDHVYTIVVKGLSAQVYTA